MTKPIHVRSRFFKIATIAVRIVFDFRKEQILVRKKGYAYAQKKMNHIHKKRAKTIYDTAVSLEGAMIKVCQYASARPEVFPKPYVDILSALQDDVPPMPFEAIEEVLLTHYGNSSRYFQSIDRCPIASASLAQIHKGKLHNGDEVVLKVLKPGIEDIIDTDSAIFFYVVKLISRIGLLRKRNDIIEAISGFMDDFFVTTGNELDFRREAYISNQFRKHLKKYEYIHIPYVYPEYSSENIIVMEYINGDKISDISSWEHRNNSPKIISRRLIDIYFYQFFFSHLVHYDPHPGNILVTENSCFALLDFGMSGHITKDMKRGVLTILIAFFITKDFRRIVDTVDDLGFFRRGFDKYSLLPVIEFVYKTFMDLPDISRETIYGIDYSPIRENILDIAVEKAFNLPPNYVYIGKAASTIFGVVVKLNPEFDLIEEGKHAIYRMIKNNFPQFLSEASEILFDVSSENLFSFIRLPKKVDSFIDHQAQKDTKNRFNHEAIYKEINNLKVYIVRFTFFILSIFFAAGAYLLKIKGDDKAGIVFMVLSACFVLISIFFRKLTLKDKIREEMGKMI